MRKHLLEYDEVMDEQRKQVYSYRQRILDGGNCRQLILEMIDKQIALMVPKLLDPAYRWETIAAWASHEMGMEIESRSVDGMDRARLEDLFPRTRRHARPRTTSREKIDEDLPREAEDQSEWNWLALSKWVNVRYGLNTNDRELKKIGRDALQADLIAPALGSDRPLRLFAARHLHRRAVRPPLAVRLAASAVHARDASRRFRRTSVPTRPSRSSATRSTSCTARRRSNSPSPSA